MSNKWTLTIRDNGSQDIPAPIRLRRLLKHLLRALGFECCDIRQASEPLELSPVEHLHEK